MTLDQIWKQLVKKKPKLQDPNATVEITSDNLRLLLKQVYEQGERRATNTNNFMEDVFNSMR